MLPRPQSVVAQSHDAALAGSFLVYTSAHCRLPAVAAAAAVEVAVEVAVAVA